ncbi:MAG: thiamine pyrophosphate-binding protein [SAR202 cluster bacterium]|nr:thiamine pyrophosphate-binding protein [SAR202 cluster bacterium]|tara:strand:- start:22969 stop:23490 length:522 start_codon:yes stop_codon:yes gene_type:complete
MTTDRPVATGVSSAEIVDKLKDLGVDHIVCIPDSYQKTLIARLMEDPGLKFMIACTEDEAIGINAGLYIGGKNPVLVIQNNGIFASINTIKAISLDAKIPTVMFVGQFQRDPMIPIEESKSRAVRMVEPTLETWGVPFFRIETPEDIGNIESAYKLAYETSGPVAIIIGAPTI